MNTSEKGGTEPSNDRGLADRALMRMMRWTEAQLREYRARNRWVPAVKQADHYGRGPGTLGDATELIEALHDETVPLSEFSAQFLADLFQRSRPLAIPGALANCDVPVDPEWESAFADAEAGDLAQVA